MKLKKVLCIAALSAAVALTGIPQSTTALVYAEETQIAGLDEILRQMYDLYQSGNFVAMYELDTNETTETYVETVKNSGSDRYVMDLDKSTKAMMYLSPDGGYWWYFGQMENNLRQGYGTTVLLSSDGHEVFTGNYTTDFPNGDGKYSLYWNDGDGYDISGNFHGTYLNGTYQVNTNWITDGIPCSSSLPVTYENNHFKSVDVDGISLSGIYSYEDSVEYVFSRDGYDFEDYFTVDIGSELFALGFRSELSWYYYNSTEDLNAGLYILQGNSNVSFTTSAPSETQTSDVQTQTPETITPSPTAVAAANTYVVERNDNLSKIAAKVYGDAKYWRTIYNANSNVIKNDYVIYANQVLTMPAL